MGARKAIGDAVVSLGEGIKPDETQPPVDQVKAPGWVVFLTILGAIVLMTLGTLVLIAGRDMWEDPQRPTTSAQPTKVVKKVVKKPGKKLGKKAARRTDKKRGKAQIVRREVTIERASQDGGLSDALALATLATGAALLLGGGFAARLTKLKLPGVEMETVAAAYGAGVRTGSVAGAQVALEAKKKGTTDVLQDDAKLANAAEITLAASVAGGINALVAALLGAKPGQALEQIDKEKMQEAAGPAVQTVSDEMP